MVNFCHHLYKLLKRSVCGTFKGDGYITPVTLGEVVTGDTRRGSTAEVKIEAKEKYKREKVTN